MTFTQRPLGTKCYYSIAHLPGSKMGKGDRKCDNEQAKIATIKLRDQRDQLIVQEKLDGSNVGVARVEGILYPLNRSGYLASESSYQQHWKFSQWVYANQGRFLAVLEDGDRLCGEWLLQAHGTRYQLPHEPFVAFDLIIGERRMPYLKFCQRLQSGDFVTPKVIHQGKALGIEKALSLLGTYGFHGALDPVEGAVWRVERNQVVDFLVKYVKPDKVNGKYLPCKYSQAPIWNTCPQLENK